MTIAADVEGSGLTREQRRKLSWHIPDDFDRRPTTERAEIVAWIRANILCEQESSYGRFQREARVQPFVLRMPKVTGLKPEVQAPQQRAEFPPVLAEELRRLVAYKTELLTPFGLRRSERWSPPTVQIRLTQFGSLFGRLGLANTGPDARDANPVLPREAMRLGLLAFPEVWDLYLRRQTSRRGQVVTWDAGMVTVGSELAHPRHGWLTQSPELAQNLVPVPGLLSLETVEQARSDWPGTCDRLRRWAMDARRELHRASRLHRDPNAPILVVLRSPAPAAEYRKIALEVERQAPDADMYPVEAAKAVRASLAIRLALQLGVRQRNLRELLVGAPRAHSPELLYELRRGQVLRSPETGGWEAYFPVTAFKNSNSSFFSGHPLRVPLSDSGDLYALLEAYISRHRPLLIGERPDTGELFVTSPGRRKGSIYFNHFSFHYMWAETIRNFGIWNPYTKRGAIPGLRVHGPHSIRHVVATHVLKATGSLEHAGHAIQCTPEVVYRHYSRLLPEEKVQLSSSILASIWSQA